MSAHEMLRSSGAHSLWGRIKAQPDLFFGVILISILLVLLVPLPPGLVDTPVSYTHLTQPTNREV